MDTKLATIQEIETLSPIPDADRIEVATIKGMAWKVVVKKNEFKVGDPCIYCMIDTVLPEKPEFEFLKKVKYRIKTCKLKKTVSQGIIFPLSIIPPNTYTLNQDVSEILGIKKYLKEIPASMSGEIKGNFPSYVPKTDGILVESVVGVLDEIKNLEVYITIKCDGTSATYSNLNGEIDVCSRNWSMKKPEDIKSNVYWEMENKYNIIEKLKSAGNYAISGEIVGQGIQKNRLQIEGHDLYVFQVYDIEKAKYLDYADMMSFCAKYELKTVPLLKTCIFNFTIDELKEMAKGNYECGNKREGIVIRPVHETYSKVLDEYSNRGRMSFKVMNAEYLLEED